MGEEGLSLSLSLLCVKVGMYVASQLIPWSRYNSIRMIEETSFVRKEDASRRAYDRNLHQVPSSSPMAGNLNTPS